MIRLVVIAETASIVEQACQAVNLANRWLAADGAPLGFGDWVSVTGFVGVITGAERGLPVVRFAHDGSQDRVHPERIDHRAPASEQAVSGFDGAGCRPKAPFPANGWEVSR